MSVANGNAVCIVADSGALKSTSPSLFGHLSTIRLLSPTMSSPPPSDLPTPTSIAQTETPAERVYSNTLVMEEVNRWLRHMEGPAGLVKMAVLCRGGFEGAAKLRF